MADKGSQFVVRCDEEFLPRVDELAGRRELSRNQLVLAVLEAAIAGDITPAVISPAGAASDITPERASLPILQLSTSQLACLDQLAERAGVERVELMSRYLGERVRREFIEDRQRQMAGAKPRAGRKGAANAQENGQ
jgi:hypothetical protein